MSSSSLNKRKRGEWGESEVNTDDLRAYKKFYTLKDEVVNVDSESPLFDSILIFDQSSTSSKTSLSNGSVDSIYFDFDPLKIHKKKKTLRWSETLEYIRLFNFEDAPIACCRDVVLTSSYESMNEYESLNEYEQKMCSIQNYIDAIDDLFEL